MHNHPGVFEDRVANSQNYEELFEFLAFIKELPPRCFLHIQYIYFNGNLASYFNNLLVSKCNILSLNQNISAFRYTIKESDSIVNGTFFIQETIFPNLYTLYSISSSSNWGKFHRLVLQRQYPRIVLLYWKQTEQIKALTLLEELLKTKYALRVKKISLKEKRESGKEQKGIEPKSTKAKYDSYLEWTSKTLFQVLDEAKEREQWFKKIVFQLFRIKDGLLSPIPFAVCNISKYGYFSCNNLFQTIFPIIRQELEPPLKERIQLFKARGLKERDYKPSPALTINYADDLFSNKSTFNYFSDIIKKYPSSTKALFHSNPYFHASIADFLDGSSLDIRISDYKTILIVPQIQTSISSLERLVSYIFDNFYEGKVEEYKSENE
jgi:hypothetical protein